MKNRKRWVDIYKAILIILVVAGHSNITCYNVIFWFHMPLFFGISGYLFNEKTGGTVVVLKSKAKRLLVPWLTYFFVLDIIPMIVWERVSIYKLLTRCAMFLWSGKMCVGVYWYSPTLLITMVLFVFLRKIEESKQVWLLLVCYLVSVAESIFLIPADNAKIPLLLRFPWNLDVCLLSIVYFAIGFYFKKVEIKIQKNTRFMLSIASIIVVVICIILMNVNIFTYDMNMKYSQYKNWMMPLILPLAFGILIRQLSRWLDEISYINRLLQICGEASMVIMYIHNPIREYIMIPFLGEKYSVIVYILLSSVLGMIIYRISNGKKWSLFILGA